MPIVIAILVLLTFVCLGLALAGRKGKTDQMVSRLETFKESGPGASHKKSAAAATPGPEDGAFKEKRSYSGLPVLSAFFGSMKGSDKVAAQLEQSGVPLRVGEYYMIRWVTAFLFFLAPLIFGINLFDFGIACLLAFIGYWLPSQWLSGKRKKRMEKIVSQLVDLLGMVSNSLKSGYGLMQSFEFASKQLPDPLGFEIRRMLRESTLGMSAEQALFALGQRLQSGDLDMVLTAINVQRAVGGNLAEILDKVAFTMRERDRIRGEIATLTSQQKMTGIVIGVLPLFMFGIFMVMNPDYMSLLFTDMTGRLILIAAIGLEIMGYFSIKRIMAIEV
ncbi:MAG: type II secretion system F family protein [Chloroflexota bacterium]